MNAPLPPAGATLQATLPRNEIVKSLTNPRKTKRKGYIEELRQTIQAVGLMHPITVRPIPEHRTKEIAAGKKYEVVIGECRFEACDFMTDIPAFWRDLDDKTVVMMQVIENLKREDVHPLEEAEGLLVLQRDHGYTLEQIEAEIGLKRSSVCNLLALNKLHEPARKAFLNGDIEHKSIAMLVARIRDPKLQLQFLKEVTETGWDGTKLTYQGALELVQSDYMLELDAAPFPTDEDNLVKGCTSCKACPKRTGNDRDLFSDVKSPDVCTDPPCYKAKADAHAKRKAQEASKDGRTVIAGDDALKIKPHSYQTELQGGMVDLDKKVDVDGKAVPVRKLLDPEDLKGAAVLMDPHKQGKTIDVIATASIKEKLEAKGVKLSTLSSRLKGADEKAEQRKEQARKEDENEFRTRLLNGIRTEYTTHLVEGKVPDQPELALITEAMWKAASFPRQQFVAKLWMGNSDIWEFEKTFAKRPEHELYRIQLDLTIAGEREEESPHRKAVVMLEIAKHRGIKTDDIKTAIIADRREKEARQKKATAKPRKAKASTEPTSTPPEAAQAQEGSAGDKKPKAAPAKKSPAKPKAKANPAPAKTPAKGTGKTKPAQASPAEETKNPVQPDAHLQNNGEANDEQIDKAWPSLVKEAQDKAATPGIKPLNPASAWPFPTSAKP